MTLPSMAIPVPTACSGSGLDASFFGGSGADSLSGGSGADVFVVASQGDFVTYFYDSGSGTDTLILGGGATIPGGGGGLANIDVTL